MLAIRSTVTNLPATDVASVNVMEAVPDCADNLIVLHETAITAVANNADSLLNVVFFIISPSFKISRAISLFGTYDF